PSKPEPTFISLGSQEKVQPAASATSPARPELFAPVSHVAPTPTRSESVPPAFTSSEPLSALPATSAANGALPSTPVDFPAAPQAVTPASLTMTELRGDQRGTVVIAPADALTAIAGAEQHAAEVAEAPAQSSRAVFGSFSGGASLSGSHAVSVDAFGARLDASHEAGMDQPAAPRGNSWILIAACVTLLFATVIGGVLYFRPHTGVPARSAAANSNSPAVPQPLAFQTPAAEPSAPEVAPAHNSATHPASIVAQAPALNPPITMNGNDSPSEGPRIVPKPASNLAPGTIKGASENHPLSAQRGDADQTVQAPS